MGVLVSYKLSRVNEGEKKEAERKKNTGTFDEEEMEKF